MFVEGISSCSKRACWAFRSRASRSDTWSLFDIVMFIPLPARLGHAGKLSSKGELPQADPAQLELPVESARPAAARTPVVFPDIEFRRPFRLGDDRFLGQRLLSSLAYARKGIPMSRSSSSPSSSVRAVVTMVMFMPRILSILS